MIIGFGHDCHSPEEARQPLRGEGVSPACIELKGFVGVAGGRRTACVAVAVCLAATLRLLAVDRPEDALDRSAAELAATLAIDKLSTALAAAEPETAPLYAAMTADPGKYSDPGEAESLLRPLFAKGISRKFAGEASRILAMLAGDDGVDKVFGAAFARSATNASPAVLAHYVEENYPKAFKSARRRACREQAGRLSAKVRPTEAEVDGTDPAKLSELLVSRIAAAQTEPVFAENMKHISLSIVKPLLEDAFNQRDWQKSLVATAAAPGFAPSAIASNTLAIVRASVAKRKETAEEPESVFGLFPSVESQTVPERAAARTGEILDGAAAATPIALNFDTLAKAIAESPASHRTARESVKAFSPGLAGKLVETAVATVSASAPEAERDELRKFADGHFLTKKTADALAARVDRELAEGLKPLRAAFAEIQLKDFWPTLADGSWFPNETLVDFVAESNDFRKALSKWRRLDELADFAQTEKANPILEETSGKLDAAIVAAFEPGVAARARQHGLVDELFGMIRKDVDAGRLPKVLEKIVEVFRMRTLDAWRSKRRETLPERFVEEKRYAGLFPSTEKKIELLAKSLTESPDEQPPKIEEPEPQPPEDPKPPPETLEEIQLDCTITFTRSHDEIQAEVAVGGKRLGRYSCPYAPTGYRKSCDDFTGKASGAIADYLDEATKKNRVALTVLLEVKDPLVYHGAVSDVSWLLRKAIERLGEYVTKFEISEPR